MGLQRDNGDDKLWFCFFPALGGKMSEFSIVAAASADPEAMTAFTISGLILDIISWIPTNPTPNQNVFLKYGRKIEHKRMILPG